LPGTLSAQDFGVVNYDTGLGILKGYTAGFGLTDATLAGATSVVVQLFAGTTLLQTNTAILSKFNADITGTQFSSPFDVSGTFNYATDGYWTNVRQAEFGQTLAATRVVATVTLANTKVVTAENDILTGDLTILFPIPVASVTTNPATNVTATSATLNGTNGPVAADNTSFWYGPSSAGPFTSAADPSGQVPAGWVGVSSGAQSANTAFTADIPGLSPNTQYFFVAWSHVNGIWYPGAVLNFTTGQTVSEPGSISGEIYNDLNRNIAFDSGEPGIAGFTINLYKGAGWWGPLQNNAPIMSAVTDANGNYSFTGLADGTYSVEEINLPAWHQDTGDYFSIVIANGAAIVNIDFANTPKNGQDNGQGNNDHGNGGYNNDHGNGFGRHDFQNGFSRNFGGFHRGR
jgi:hypothetical protein